MTKLIYLWRKLMHSVWHLCYIILPTLAPLTDTFVEIAFCSLYSSYPYMPSSLHIMLEKIWRSIYFWVQWCLTCFPHFTLLQSCTSQDPQSCGGSHRQHLGTKSFGLHNLPCFILLIWIASRSTYCLTNMKNKWIWT